MKRLAFYASCGLLLMLGPGLQHGYGQSDASSKSAQINQQQMIKELLNEVHQLRLDLRRMTANAYRAQAMTDRLRLQQEQVNRLTLELSKVRNQISDLKSARVDLKEKAAALEKKVEAGVIPGTELDAVKAAIQEINRREPDLIEREFQLTGELTLERSNLVELNRRMDEIEQALLTISKDEEDKPEKRAP